MKWWTSSRCVRLNWPCWVVACAACRCSRLLGKWERTPPSEHCSCCRSASESSPRTSTGSRGRGRGGWSGSVRRGPTGWSWFWDWPYRRSAPAAWCNPASAATQTTATWCRRAWSGACPPARGPGPGRTATATCCRCCPSVPCCSWACCSSRRHNEACMAPDSSACSEAASDTTWCWEEEKKNVGHVQWKWNNLVVPITNYYYHYK